MMRSVPAFLLAFSSRLATRIVSTAPTQRLFHWLTILTLAGALSACGLLPEQKDETTGWSANKLYSEAKVAQEDAAWDKASKMLEKLEARFPYGRLAQQAQLELGYVYWRAGELGAALAACDRFIKLHPNHPGVDYVYYLKGLINFNEDQGLIAYLSNQDPTERDPRAARDAFDAFRELATRFPESKYTPDAIQRMNYLVNALAYQEVHVARYYYSRSAYIAAANRAQTAIKTYPEAPAVEQALYVMMLSYEQLGMKDLRDDTERVLRTNFPQTRLISEGFGASLPWWKLW